MDGVRVDRLQLAELDLIRPLLVDLYLSEQGHYQEHPQLSRPELESSQPSIESHFEGENVIFAVRDGERIAGFCWCVLFDPGTGLEGEVAEVYVDGDHRGQGIGEAMVRSAVELFKERGVTLGYVWTRSDNLAAVRLYRGAGFEPTSQLVLTWYPGAI